MLTPARLAHASLSDVLPADFSSLAWHVGVCGLCYEESACTPLSEVVSVNYTDWDKLPRGAALLCEPCAWGFLSPSARMTPLIMDSSSGIAGIATGTDLHLLSTPLPATVAVSYPIAHRKHVLPLSQWGSVSSDYDVTPWGVREAACFTSFAELREAGCPESVLAKGAVPPAQLLLRKDAEVMSEHWEVLRQWRGSPTFRVSMLASRSPRSDTASVSIAGSEHL